MNRTEYKKLLIRQIHVSPRYREFYSKDDDAYRELLHQHFAQRSSKNLNIDQLVMLRDYMNLQSATLPVQKPKPSFATPSQLTTLRGMWARYADDESDAALLKFAVRIIKKQCLHLKNLTLSEAQKLISVLDKMQNQGGEQWMKRSPTSICSSSSMKTAGSFRFRRWSRSTAHGVCMFPATKGHTEMRRYSETMQTA